MKPKIYLNNYFGIEPNDTALCNRIYWWELAQEINRRHSYIFDVLCDDVQYQDLYDYLKLPNTNLYQENQKYLVYNTTNNLPDSLHSISFDDMIDILEDKKKLDIENDYKLDFEFWIMDEDISKTIKNRAIHDVKFEYKGYGEIIQSAYEYVGIHVRRNNGVTVRRDDILSLPPYLQNKYKKLVFENPNRDKGYKFHHDSVYFRVISLILKQNPNQKFYVSHDLDEEYFTHWKDKFPNRIFTRQDFIDENNTDINLINLFDLFFLSNTEFLLASPSSSWSRFAYEYNQKIWNNIIDPNDYILNNYEKYYQQKLDID